MKLFVLAGGFGMRIRPLIGEQPKALANVNGKPFLVMQMENWISKGFTDFYFLLHYGSKAIIDYANEMFHKFPQVKSVNFVVEPKPLGTGGAIINGLQETNVHGTFFLTNADTWIDVDFNELVSQPSSAIGVHEVANVSKFGSVTIDAHNVVTSFTEKNKKEGPGLVYAGIARLETHLFDSFDLKHQSLETDLYPSLCSCRSLHGVKLKGSIVDIGVPDSLIAFRAKQIGAEGC